MTFPRRTNLLAMMVIVAACGRSAPRQADADGARDASPFEPRVVEIRDYWMGLEPQGPIEAVYHLERQGITFAFAGTGELTQARRRHAGPLRIAIPGTAMRAFLRGLEVAPRAPGRYEPRIEHTDDYPELTIRLRADTAVAEFYSASQGNDRRPWRVTIGGREYVSDSAIPAEAFSYIQPYLRRAELDRHIVYNVPAAASK
ncbi:MAG TPA: hypothetical protein VF092_04205 [Longimicrobium sp.]